MTQNCESEDPHFEVRLERQLRHGERLNSWLRHQLASTSVEVTKVLSVEGYTTVFVRGDRGTLLQVGVNLFARSLCRIKVKCPLGKSWRRIDLPLATPERLRRHVVDEVKKWVLERKVEPAV